MKRLIVAVFLALVLCPSLTPADETTTVAEGLFQKLRAGNIEGARTGYLRSLDTVFERLRGEPKVPIPNDKAAGDLANLVQIVFKNTTA